MAGTEDVNELRAAAEAAVRAAEEAQRKLAEANARLAETGAASAAGGLAPGGWAAGDSTPDESSADEPTAGPALSEFAAEIAAGYTFEGPVLQLGALVEDGHGVPGAQVTIPFGMLNRHGLIAGATGTGKTKTLQVLAEQVAAGGVPVFAADIKGDLSGIASPGIASEKLLERCTSIGQEWVPHAATVEYFTLGGLGTGVPIRATVESFGSILLAKVLGLNETQESSLSLVFHYAESKGRPLSTIEDLRRVLVHLDGDGRDDLKAIGGISTATIGVILRELTAFAHEGADAFFGRPEIDVADFLRTTSDGRGVVSLLEIPGVQDKPALFSTFLMYLLQQLFAVLPEVGDTDKPKLVFFFDEAHLLFKDASKDFLATITQTVRLIRSKGVGVFFVTQTPKDVPTDVLAQLGSRVQHQLRAHTPQDAKLLKSAVQTFPNTEYNLAEVLTTLSIGEAIVTVMSDKGAPTPVAHTRMRAPQGSMDPTPADQIAATVAGSPLMARYGTPEPQAAEPAVGPAVGPAADADEDASSRTQREAERLEETLPKAPKPRTTRTRRKRKSETERILGNAANQAARTATREIFKRIFKR